MLKQGASSLGVTLQQVAERAMTMEVKIQGKAPLMWTFNALFLEELCPRSHLSLFLWYSPAKPYTRASSHKYKTNIHLTYTPTNSRQFTLVTTKIAPFWSPLFTHYFVCSLRLTSRQQLNVFSAAVCSQFISEQHANMTTSRDSWDLKLYLALLGGSYCKTQWTSGMSMPRAITSVQTKMPLGRRRKSIFSLNCHLRRASLPPAVYSASTLKNEEQSVSKHLFFEQRPNIIR